MVTKELMYIIMNAKSLSHCISKKRTKLALHKSGTSLRNNSSVKSLIFQEAELVNWPSELLECLKAHKRRKELDTKNRKVLLFNEQHQ